MRTRGGGKGWKLAFVYFFTDYKCIRWLFAGAE